LAREGLDGIALGRGAAMPGDVFHSKIVEGDHRDQ
jgi:hypothetical protein